VRFYATQTRPPSPHTHTYTHTRERPIVNHAGVGRRRRPWTTSATTTRTGTTPRLTSTARRTTTTTTHLSSQTSNPTTSSGPSRRRRTRRLSATPAGDPAKTPGADNLPKGRHGETLKKGVPLSGKVRCWACDAVTTTQLECALCLEIMKERAVKAAYDNWERAFFCSHLCYREHYPNHKARHGPSKSVPTKTDGDHPPVPVRRRVRRALGRKDAQTIQLRGVRAVRLNSAG